MTDKKNGGLGPAKRPSQQQDRDGNNIKASVSNISSSLFPPPSQSLCSICSGGHSVLVIPLENGGHVITRPFPKKKATRVDVTNVKGRATRLDLVDILWRND